MWHLALGVCLWSSIKSFIFQEEKTEGMEHFKTCYMYIGPSSWFLDPHVPPQLLKVIHSCSPQKFLFHASFHAEVLFPLGKVMEGSFPFWDAWLLSVPCGQVDMVLICFPWQNHPESAWKILNPSGRVFLRRGEVVLNGYRELLELAQYFPFRTLSGSCGFTAIGFWWASHSGAQVARDKHGFALSFLQM